MTDFLFYLFAAFAVAGALGMLLNVKNTVAGALSLVGTMVALGAIYVLLDAYLIGVLQILVYAGAIVVLFLFVVMLLNLRSDDFPPTRQRLLKVVIMIWLQMALRWTLPRFRYDQVMDLCWKMILPLSIVNVFVTGAVILFLERGA